MADNNDALQARFDKLEASVQAKANADADRERRQAEERATKLEQQAETARASAEQARAETARVKAEADAALVKAQKDSTEALTKATAELAQARELFEKQTKEHTEARAKAEAERDAATKVAADLQAKQGQVQRLALVQAKLGCTAEEAAKWAEPLATLPEAAFAQAVDHAVATAVLAVQRAQGGSPTPIKTISLGGGPVPAGGIINQIQAGMDPKDGTTAGGDPRTVAALSLMAMLDRSQGSGQPALAVAGTVPENSEAALAAETDTLLGGLLGGGSKRDRRRAAAK